MTVNKNIFKAYDVRGIYPTEINATDAYAIGRAFVAHIKASTIAVGRDMRTAAPEIAAAFIDGATSQGANVTDYGMVATDMLYYGVAKDGFDGGAEITASHNPKEYIGIKLVRRDAVPLSIDTGIGIIRDMVASDNIPQPGGKRGTHHSEDILNGYIRHVLSFIDTARIRPYRVVLDAGSGIAGLVAPHLFDRLSCKTTRMCFDVDGTFPNHEANPLLEENRRHIVERVIAEQADIGIAWDGDADRCFFIDGDGRFISGDLITALLAQAFLLKSPGEKVIYDVRASHAIKDVVSARGGIALMNRVGHAFIKTRMREENAIFGGEVTGHYYFRDNFFADNGFIPALLILELMSIQEKTLSELLAPLHKKYFLSGEINTKMPDMETVEKKINTLANRYRDGHVYRLDGVSVEFDDWHFNVRRSNTEPLIRLNLEAATESEMKIKRDEILAIIREPKQH